MEAMEFSYNFLGWIRIRMMHEGADTRFMYLKVSLKTSSNNDASGKEI